MRVVLLWMLALMLPAGPGAAVCAQAWQRPHADVASDDQPVRRIATAGYKLSIIWQPEACHARPTEASRPGPRATECANPRAARGFTLHGLWPDGADAKLWPQYCRPVPILTDAEIRAGIAATPSAQLLQHEWAKHGSCMSDSASRYFAEEARLYAGIRMPDMAALAARRGVRAGEVQEAFARANPGMTADMLRLDVNRRGWLQEVWFCLGLDKRPRRCPAGQAGAEREAVVRIQRPG